MENLLLTWASRYVKVGWSLIPICTRDKKPLIPWQEFQKRRASLEEIQGWVNKWPIMNLGIVTGNISGLVVVDLDGLTGKEFGIKNHLVSSVMQITGCGQQLFYKWTEHVDNSVSKIAPGVDIRGDGGYVVVCPSIHPNGKRYRWERFVPSMMTEMVPGLITSNTKSETIQSKPQGWIAAALEEMRIGNIDDTIVSISGRLRRDGYSSSDAITLLKPHTDRAGATEGHLEDKIKHIWSSYEPNISRQVRNSVEFSRFEVLGNNELSIHSPADDDSFNRFNLSLHGNGSVQGWKTGFPTLDKYFEGGLKSERPFVIAARTGVGKTNVAITLSRNLCEQSKKVLFFSTEFRYEKIWARYIATLKDPERFREHKFFVCDGFTPAIEQVETAIKQIQPDVFIFDFIQHIGKEKEILTLFMNGCAFLQRKYNCQAIILAQLNRMADWVEDGKRVEPRLSMVEGSSTIEQSASRVLLLTETRVTPEYNEIQAILAKNDTGDKGVFTLALYKNPYRIEELI